MSRLSRDMAKCATRRRRERGPMLWSGARSSPSLITIWERFLCAKATPPEAIAQFEQALRFHPDFPEAKENLRLAKAGDPQFPSQSPSRILVGPCSARLAFSAYCSRDR